MFLFFIKNNPSTNPKEIKTMKRVSFTLSFHLILIVFLFMSLIAQSQIKILTDGSTQGGLSFGALRLETAYKYIDIGCQNSNGQHSHFYTNATSGYWFDKELMIGNGLLKSYTSDLVFFTGTNQRMKILYSNGYVAISNNTSWVPSYKLDVDGSIGANHVQLNSDSRIKNNIKELDKSRIDKCLNPPNSWT
jgi:hypothetical protein